MPSSLCSKVPENKGKTRYQEKQTRLCLRPESPSKPTPNRGQTQADFGSSRTKSRTRPETPTGGISVRVDVCMFSFFSGQGHQSSTVVNCSGAGRGGEDWLEATRLQGA